MPDHHLDRSRRLVLHLAGLLLCVLVLLAGRLGWLHLTLHEQAVQAVARRTLRTTPIPARRGELFDRHGRALAVNAPALQVAVWPPKLASLDAEPGARLSRARRVAERLAPAVDATPDTLLTGLLGERNRVLGAPVTDVPTQRWIRAAVQHELAGLDLAEGSVRRYPWGAVAGNLVGFLDHTGAGAAGLERGLDPWLAGVDGERVRRVDPGNHEQADPTLPVTPPVDGLDVTLSLDVKAQQIVEQELLALRAAQDAEAAVAVLLEARTGELLALASVPGLDPDHRAGITTAGTRLRAAQDTYAPGSTFKPLMMAAALELGLAHPADPPILCDRFEGRRLRDTHPQEHPLTLAEILVHSSNIGMAKILTRITPEDRPRDTAAMAPLHAILGRLGLGAPTGLPLPGETAGKVTELAKWDRRYTVASISFGQELAVSAVQMAAAANALADGFYRPPRLVLGVRRADGVREAFEPPAPTPVFRPGTVELVRDWMAQVVEQGACAEVRLPGLPVAGKTGTADLEDDLDAGLEFHSFVALLPADDPQFTLLVGVRAPRHARYASQSAAPAAGRILRRLAPYLGLDLDTDREGVRG